ncbi:hypothetical protein TUBRATIS_003690 [Tubulinosema ratisbonensis]|uniref:Transmembrane protein n=1 Tax=Tubulinosema ratisbonensis TaxID=291195 RepID=A0A437AQ18_9MICR|nr:hypothetical protein TUBRATIS_003690 [Tubulinosema ratisbonensis]
MPPRDKINAMIPNLSLQFEENEDNDVEQLLEEEVIVAENTDFFIFSIIRDINNSINTNNTQQEILRDSKLIIRFFLTSNSVKFTILFVKIINFMFSTLLALYTKNPIFEITISIFLYSFLLIFEMYLPKQRYIIQVISYFITLTHSFLISKKLYIYSYVSNLHINHIYYFLLLILNLIILFKLILYILCTIKRKKMYLLEIHFLFFSFLALMILFFVYLQSFPCKSMLYLFNCYLILFIDFLSLVLMFYYGTNHISTGEYFFCAIFFIFFCDDIVFNFLPVEFI